MWSGCTTSRPSARRELRAAGERSGQPAPRALDLLAPQELEIARLAAGGLSNREIGQQLYLWATTRHRTRPSCLRSGEGRLEESRATGLLGVGSGGSPEPTSIRS